MNKNVAFGSGFHINPVLVFIDQRKIKLKSMEQEGDLDTVLAKLVDTAGKLNVRRFECAIEIKVVICFASVLSFDIPVP